MHSLVYATQPESGESSSAAQERRYASPVYGTRGGYCFSSMVRCLVSPLDRMQGCVTSCRRRLAAGDVARSMEMLDARIVECEKREAALEGQLIEYHKRLRLTASTLVGDTELPAHARASPEVVKIRLQDLLRQKKSCERKLRRAIKLTATIRREADSLDECSTNSEVVAMLQRVLRYTQGIQPDVATAEELMDRVEEANADGKECTKILGREDLLESESINSDTDEETTEQEVIAEAEALLGIQCVSPMPEVPKFFPQTRKRAVPSLIEDARSPLEAD